MVVRDGTSDDRREVLVVGNPFSGKRGNERHVEELLNVLASRGLRPLALWKPEERREALSQPDLAGRFRCVIVAGGDGTVRDVLSQRPPVPMAVFPLGNENLFAKEFRFDLNCNRLADCIERGRSRAVDVGLVGSECFGVVVSAGFDAEVVRRVAEWRLHKTGIKRVNNFSYVPRVLSALVSYDFPSLELETEEGRVKGYQVFVLNFNRYGMGLPLAPDARCDNGLLDWLVLKRPGRFNLVKCVLRLMLKSKLPASIAERGRARKLTIRSETPVPVEVDGDAFGVTPIELSIQPRVAKVLDTTGV
jgi:diacylglycerol kinase family enzyme